LAEATTARRHFIEIGDRAREAQCQEVIAGVAARRAHFDQAEDLLEESLQALAGSGNRFLEIQHLRSLALLHLARGEHDVALATLDRADRLCDEAGLDDLAVDLLSIRGSALLATGSGAQASAATREAVARITPGVERPYLIYHRHALAVRAQGNLEEASGAAFEADRLLNIALAGLSAKDREDSVNRVPEHREIVSARVRFTPRTIDVTLPAAGAPTGRPLEGDETRLVRWTIDHPEDNRIGSTIERRRKRLLRLIAEAEQEGAIASIDHLAGALGVSDSTVRRDLSALRTAGYRVMTRGRQQAS
jgi:tetratricopeptide (TPR) repeat protein